MAEKKQTRVQKIKSLLTGDAQKNALDFDIFLRENKIPANLYVLTIVGDGGNFPHIRPWVIFFTTCDFNYDETPGNDLIEFAWKHAHICDHFITDGKRCGCGRQPGSREIIFGKDFENICHCPMQFINPDADTLENVKSLLLILKQKQA